MKYRKMQKENERPNDCDEISCNICAGCLNILNDDEIICALEQEWHLECFRCSACDAALSNWYFEKDGLLFCKLDYYSRYGEACQQCGQVITGPVMVAGEHKFHPECFCCSSCCAFIGDGDSYALVERSKLFCGQCYKRQMQPLQRIPRFPFARKSHSIRLVEIPGGQKGLKLTEEVLSTTDNQCFTISEVIWKLHGKLIQLAFAFLTSAFKLCCYFLPSSYTRLDMNNDLMSLHVGDKILEINGTPVKDTPIENVENLLRYSDSVLQLTIEHDPDTISKKFVKSKTPQSLPLTTTASDTNIPDKKSSISLDVKSLGSSDSINEDCVMLQEENYSLRQNNGDIKTKSSNIPNKERIFKRRDEGYMSGTRSRQLKRKNILSDNKQSLDKERSSSMSRLLDDVTNSKRCQDLSRAYSFLESKPQQRVFRASDLVKGELLGQGFFGQVFKVTTRDTKEVMVLKELYKVDEEAQKNFLKEVAVLRNLHHNNVLRFIGVLYKEKKLHLVTEYISGGTLTELIHDINHLLPWEQRVSFAKDIAAGMAYLHSMNIIHRDLNSHNCLVREDRTVVVADFGLARIVSHNTDSVGRRMTSKSSNGSKRQERKKRYTVVGNPYWMAPEMMKGNKYDEKVDIFSFGIVLCEIIGRVQADPDFLPRSNDFGLNQISFKEKFCGSCPEPFYRVAFLCTDLNADKRPPFEVTEVWLESLLLHLSVGTTPPSDLLFDICRFKGISPNSSGSTTPEGVPSGHRSPALQPICEGKMIDTNKKIIEKTIDNNSIGKSVKGSSTENLINYTKPIIKVSSSNSLDCKNENNFNSNYDEFHTKSCEDMTPSSNKNFREYPNYENIDFLKKETATVKPKNEKFLCAPNFTGKLSLEDGKKNKTKENVNKIITVSIENIHEKLNCETEPNDILKVQLRKVTPRTYTKNKLYDNSPKVLGNKNLPDTKKLNLSLESLSLKTNNPSKVTEKYVNSSDPQSNPCESHSTSYRKSDSPSISIVGLDIPDIVSSTLIKKFNISDRKNKLLTSQEVMEHLPAQPISLNNTGGTFSINRSIFKRNEQHKNLNDTIVKCNDRNTQNDVSCLKLKDSTICDISEPSSSSNNGSSLVRSIVDSLNRKDKGTLNLGMRMGYGRNSLKTPTRTKNHLGNSNEYTAL